MTSHPHPDDHGTEGNPSRTRQRPELINSARPAPGMREEAARLLGHLISWIMPPQQPVTPIGNGVPSTENEQNMELTGLRQQLDSLLYESNALRQQLLQHEHQHEQVFNALRQQRQNNTILQSNIKTMQQHWAALKSDYDKTQEQNKKLDSNHSFTSHELGKQRGLVEQLRGTIRQQQQTIEQQQHCIDNANETAFSQLVEDVSVELPDDEIQAKFGRLFGTGFDGWCLDNSAPEIDPVVLSKCVDISTGLVWSSPDLPAHLAFDPKDEVSSVLLLQSALSRHLCDAFLKSPFFIIDLVMESDSKIVHFNPTKCGLDELLSQFATTSKSAAVEWRIQTVNLLQKVLPVEPKLVRSVVTRFLRGYACLIQPPSEQMESELTDIAVSFAKLSQRLWKRKSTISVWGIEKLGGAPFAANAGLFDADPSVSLLLGDTALDGRPMCVVTKPLIMASSVEENGESEQKVRTVWSKASVWISSASAENAEIRIE